MKDLLSIGEVAKVTGISIQALRHYDKIGLLKPKEVKENSNYRYYTQRQLVLIDIIKYGKYIGSTLEEIKEVINNEDINELYLFLERAKEKLIEKEREIKFIMEDLDLMKNRLNSEINNKKDNYIEEVYVDERYIIKSKIEDERDILEIETKSREIEWNARKKGYMNKAVVGYILGRDNYNRREVFTQIENKAIREDGFEVIKEGIYVIASYNKSDREIMLKEIEAYIKQRGYKKKNILEIYLIDSIKAERFQIQIQI